MKPARLYHRPNHTPTEGWCCPFFLLSMDKIASDSKAHEGSEQARKLAVLDVTAIESASLVTEPYQFVSARQVIALDRAVTLLADAPNISSSGSISLEGLIYGPSFKALIDDLESPLFRRIVERKFALDLSDFSTTVSVRGHLRRAADGYVHTDLEDKIITVLLYLNAGWHGAGGVLRVLRSRNIEDHVLEIPPEFGNMLIFRRSDCSWHGHLPYEGPRLSLQFNWVRSPRRPRQFWRHRLNFLKGFTRLGV
jgi:SM-20-related protein